MNVIFLDIDGVLNYKDCTERCGKYIGIDGDKVKLLARLVDATDAKIVLVSTWKEKWHMGANKHMQDYIANYLDEKLRAAGLAGFDKTPNKYEGQYLGRGEGIVVYIHSHDVKRFVILDDCQYDYDSCDLTEYWVKTNYDAGLTEENVQQAIILMEKDWQ